MTATNTTVTISLQELLSAGFTLYLEQLLPGNHRFLVAEKSPRYRFLSTRPDCLRLEAPSVALYEMLLQSGLAEVAIYTEGELE